MVMFGDLHRLKPIPVAWCQQPSASRYMSPQPVENESDYKKVSRIQACCHGCFGT